MEILPAFRRHSNEFVARFVGGQTHAHVTAVSCLGTHLRVETVREEGYPLVALVQRSHPMADRLRAGDAVRAAAIRGSVLPDPLGGKEPDYYL